MDLSKLSLADLKSLLNQLPAEIAKREKEEKAQALRDLEALAAERGFSLQELLDGAKGKKERAPSSVKYRHPTDNGVFWAGRGKKPNWLKEFLEKGGKLEQLQV